MDILIDKITKLNLKPNDLLMVHVPDCTSLQELGRLKLGLSKVFGDSRIGIVNKKMDYTIIERGSNQVDDWGRGPNPL